MIPESIPHQQPGADEMSMSINATVIEDARRFDHFSIHNAVQAQLACPESSCQAYADIFTFKRWRAQGFVVMKGEKGARVKTWIPITRTDE